MPRNTYAVAWTGSDGWTVVKTKKEGREMMRAWKERYEAMTWKVRSFGTDAYIATDSSDSGNKHSIVFHEYNAVTKKRIWPEVRKSAKNQPSAA